MPATPVVHALLACRALDAQGDGGISLQNVIEVVPVAALPGDAGPLILVALVRNLPPGPGEGAFVLRPPAGEPDEPPLPAQRLPIRVDVPAGLGDRQLALHVRLPHVPVSRGGWHEFHFEWEGAPLAANRFAVGIRS
ncbi:MAG: hypothetical protein O2894_08850 [Planctomycetota bacterium]|nr:hypothetical protein [Planctomycetota bacterium]